MTAGEILNLLFFSSRRRHTRCLSDWSSDVCSSDLDKAVIHGLRGKPSNRRIEEAIEREAVKILSADVYRGFGPTLAAEYLRKKHGIEASKETVRQWMIQGKLWRAKAEKLEQVHVWRPRRSRYGE